MRIARHCEEMVVVQVGRVHGGKSRSPHRRRWRDLKKVRSHCASSLSGTRGEDSGTGDHPLLRWPVGLFVARLDREI
jgi:hypothetical protein